MTIVSPAIFNLQSSIFNDPRRAVAKYTGCSVQGHEKDLELARACERGDETAWNRFIGEYRPILYRSADAIDPSGGAREVADSLYAELYGLKESEGKRKSLFAYFQGRSSLATWLRAILAQRYVDRIRGTRRLEDLADEFHKSQHQLRDGLPNVVGIGIPPGRC